MASATTETTTKTPAERATAQLDKASEIPALNPDDVTECLRTGRPIKELLEFGDEVWETMYTFGFRNFVNAQYVLAEYWWTQACLFDSRKDRNWIALGVACKRQKKYEQALSAFSLAVHNGSTNPWAPLHAVECHLQLNHLHPASLALETVMRWAANSDDKVLILKKAKMLRRGIERRLQREPASDASPGESKNLSSSQ